MFQTFKPIKSLWIVKHHTRAKIRLQDAFIKQPQSLLFSFPASPSYLMVCLKLITELNLKWQKL